MNIKLNKKLDRKVYLDFREAHFSGVNFGKIISRDHPKINKDNYISYITNFYSAHRGELARTLKETKKCFNDVGVILFSELEKYFGRDYSRDNYVCYLSMFDCNPRYIDKKCFQVYYRRTYRMRKAVIAHELTHFAFYDFCYSLGLKDSNELWELSEIFNILFLNMPLIKKITGSEELLFYPELESKYKKIKKLWEKDLSAKEFILNALNTIKR